MNTTIEVNGITLSGEAQNVLKSWHSSGSQTQKSDPERYVEYLNDTQDCLIRVMLENGLDTQDIADLLTKLICIKDDLKLLIPQSKEL
ncbi:MAG: hypothetical protein LBS20_10805 [Prevotella sp.]|jgi:hypothetical protein|nr:hypothetical protein [Prevotella sp.]